MAATSSGSLHLSAAHAQSSIGKIRPDPRRAKSRDARIMDWSGSLVQGGWHMSTVDISELRIHDLIEQEWLATNGLGGFASSTIAGLNTRKYHGLLVAAMAPPARRMVILSRVDDVVHAAGRSFSLSSCEYPGLIHPTGHQYLRAFS